MELIIDALGWECPKPVIEAKRALDSISSGTVKILVDNDLALSNLLDYGRSLGYEVAYNEDNNTYQVTIAKTTGDSGISIANEENLVIVISSNVFGQGNDDLGSNLMKSFIYALTETEIKPKFLIFINGGVFLTTEGTPVEESLRVLDASGVEIYSCGACLNFFGLEDKLIIGKVGNMYLFAEKMVQSTNVLRL